MKITDKKTERLDMRISKNDKILIDYLAKKWNMSTAQYISCVLDNVLAPIKQKIKKGELSYDDIENFCNNKLQHERFFK